MANTYIIIKVLFLILDLVSLIIYIWHINKYKFRKFLLIVLIFGILCLYVSYNNILLLIENTHKFTYGEPLECSTYLFYRLITYFLEWSQYILFLWFIKNGHVYGLLLSIMSSTIIIYCNYTFLELVEYELTRTGQYVSPFDYFLFS